MKVYACLGFLLSSLTPALAAIPVPVQTTEFNPTPGAACFPIFSAIEPPLGSGLYYAAIDPGHLIYLRAIMQPIVSGTLYEPKKVTILSMTGAKIEKNTLFESILISPGVYQTSFLNKLPYTYVNEVSGFTLPIRANALNASGHSEPVHVIASIEGNIVTDYGIYPDSPRSPFTAIYDFTVPVTESPSLEVSAEFYSIHNGELRRDSSATIEYHATAAGSPMTNLTFRARIPTGTTLVPGQIYPAGGVQSGDKILWRIPGPITRFDATLAIRVDKRPGVKTAVAKYSAVADVLDYARSASGELKMPIKGYDKGNIDYYTDSGTGGEVTVGGTYQFYCSGWDLAAGDISVSLNDVGITSVPLELPLGEFKVPPFRDADLHHILSARQTGPTVDTVVTGKVAAQVEMAEGVVKITDGSTVYRRLEDGSTIAEGEVPAHPDPLAGSNRFGLLQIDGPTGAALVRFEGDTRLLYARGGDVSIYGGIQAAKLEVHTGSALATVPFGTPGEDLTAYNTINMPDLTTFLVSETSSTPAKPLKLAGFNYSGPWPAGRWLHEGPVELNGGLLYIEGDAIFNGDIIGEGAIVCTGNFTHKGKLRFVTNNKLAIGVQGTFSTSP